MANVTVDEIKLENLAEAVRQKISTSEKYTLDEIAKIITELKVNAIVPLEIKNAVKVINSDGTVTITWEDGATKFEQNGKIYDLNIWTKTVLCGNNGDWLNSIDPNAVIYESTVADQHKTTGYIVTNANQYSSYYLFAIDNYGKASRACLVEDAQ